MLIAAMRAALPAGAASASASALPEPPLRIGPLRAAPAPGVAAESFAASAGEDVVFGDAVIFAASAGDPGRGPSRLAALAAAAQAGGLEGSRAAELNGEFAFGRFEPGPGRLTLLRDHLGCRSLLYAARPEGLVFATHPEALFAAGADPAAIDPVALAGFVAARSPGSGRTCRTEIHELAPGRLLRVEADARPGAQERFWTPGARRLGLGSRAGEADWIAHLSQVLRDAVALRLRDAARPGVRLSGGLDSSAVAGLILDLRPDDRLPAFAHVPAPADRQAGAERDDGLWLDRAEAAWPRLDLRRVRSDGRDPLGAARRRAAAERAPCFDPFQFAEDALDEAAGEAGCDLVLTGFGGDFCVSAPPDMLLLELALAGRPGAALAEYRRLRRAGLSARGALWRHGLRAFLPPGLRRRLRARRGPPPELAPLAPEMRENPRLRAILAERWMEEFATAPRGMRAVIVRSLDGWLGGKLGREAEGGRPPQRHPLLDPVLIDACLSAPPEIFAAGGAGRGLLREIARPWLPEAIRRRRGKGDFDPGFARRLAAAAPALRAELAAMARSPVFAAMADPARIERFLVSLEEGERKEAFHAGEGPAMLAALYAGAFLQAEGLAPRADGGE